jgi:cardiolipin synthase
MNPQLISTLIAVALVLVYVIAIFSAIEAIMKARTSQGAVAWTISLLTLPYITVPLYLVFGRNKFDRYWEQRDEIEQESLRLINATSDLIEQHKALSNDTPLYASLSKLTGMPATTGNRVELLVDGEQTFASILAGLAAAEHYILFQFYIIRDDDLGRRLCRVLADRARAGLKVFLLYDEIGSHKFPGTRLYRQLQMTGVKVAPFKTTQGRRNRFQLNFRNHRKNVVVDGKYAWIGGHNVGDEYLGLNKRRGHWRDTHTRVAGPAVLGAVLAFATDWHWATRSPMNVAWQFSGERKGDSKVLVFPSDPASEYEEAGLMYHQAIVQATQRIWIASPYFVPDHAIISALQLAALRGVDVRVLIPDEPDGPVVAMANWAYTRELLPTGVKVYRYQGGFMHQKVLLMDDHIAGVGTANFDNRSFRLNFEITLLVDDPAFATQVDQMLQADLRRSRQVDLADFDNKPAWFPVAMGVARLLAPML